MFRWLLLFRLSVLLAALLATGCGPAGSGESARLKAALGGASSDAEYVSLLYEHLLGHPPSPEDELYYTGLLKYKTATRADVAADVFSSDEYRKLGGFVVRVYLGVLSRPPDYGGWSNWHRQMIGGMTPEQVIEAFLASPEYQARFGAASDEAFLEAAYRGILEREPDPEGRQFWLDQLRSGTVTRPALLVEFLNSEECIRATRRRVDAYLLCLGFFGNAPDSVYDYWLKKLASAPVKQTVKDLLADAG